MTYTKHFNLHDMRASLVSLVDRFPVNQRAEGPAGSSGCTYSFVKDGFLVPVCVIGQWFAQRGLLGLLNQDEPLFHKPSEAWMKDVQHTENYGVCGVGDVTWEALAKVGITLSEEAQQYARYVQSAQDSGRTWRTAITYADDRIVWNAGHEIAYGAGIAFTQEPGEQDDKYLDLDAIADKAAQDERMAAAGEAPLADWERELLAGGE